MVQMQTYGKKYKEKVKAMSIIPLLKDNHLVNVQPEF